MTNQTSNNSPVVNVNLTIDGNTITVPKGTTVYQASQQLGIDIPIFCYHDRMPPFGACRVCLVEVENMNKVQASCTLEATEGMVVKTQSSTAVGERNGILELLLINHPLDCPICDRGGECPLQENVLQHGPGESRFFEEKRHFKKPLPLGPVLMLDRERCIICARCTRFGDIIAGDHALQLLDRGYKTEVCTPDEGPAESKFIGNTIMICPVGALTSQVYRFRARPWDNQPTNSTCTLCPVGCSMILDSRDGEIMRTRSRENRDVNDIWLCDKGWFGYEFSYRGDRLMKPLIRKDGKLVESTWDEALALIAKKFTEAKTNRLMAGFGGNPLTTEENYLFQKLFRDGATVNHLDHRIGTPLFALDDEGLPPGMEMSIGEMEELSFAVLLGIDLTEEFPLLWLRLKQAINKGATVLFMGHFAPEIAPHLDEVILHAPGKEIEILQQQIPRLKELASSGKKGALFIGSQYLSSPQRKTYLSMVTGFKNEFPGISLNILEGRGNSMGARIAGMRPDLGPLNKPLAQAGYDALKVLRTASLSGWDFLYVAGANPVLKYPSELWHQARSKLKFLIVQDLFMTETAAQADVVLPTLSFVEKGGSFVNIEGRVQRLLPGKEIPEGLFSDGEIFAMIAKLLHLPIGIETSFSSTLKQERVPLSRPQKVEASSTPTSKNPESLAATFAHALFDHGVRMMHNSHVIKLAKEPFVRVNPSEAAKKSFKEGDVVHISANQQTITAKVSLDKTVAEGTVVLPLGFPEVAVQDLAQNLLNGLEVEISLPK